MCKRFACRVTAEKSNQSKVAKAHDQHEYSDMRGGGRKSKSLLPPYQRHPFSQGFFSMSFDFDMLGDPIPENFGQRGKPPHVVTEEKRKLVIQLAAFDYTKAQIAAALGITKPTLRKYYLSELKKKDDALLIVRAKALSHLMKQVEAGSVSAISKYLDRLDKHERKVMAEEMASSKPEKKIYVGKKQKAREDAAGHKGKYAPPSAPGTVH